MRQSAEIGAQHRVDKVHRHAWRIRRQTISKPAKTDMVNRVFASGFDYWLSRGYVGSAKINKSGFITDFSLFSNTFTSS